MKNELTEAEIWADVVSVKISRSLLELAGQITDSARGMSFVPPQAESVPVVRPVMQAAHMTQAEYVRQWRNGNPPARSDGRPTASVVLPTPPTIPLVAPSDGGAFSARKLLIARGLLPASALAQDATPPVETAGGDAGQPAQKTVATPGPTRSRGRSRMKKAVRYTGFGILGGFSTIGVLASVGMATNTASRHALYSVLASVTHHSTARPAPPDAALAPAPAPAPGPVAAAPAPAAPSPSERILPDSNIEIVMGHATDQAHNLFVFSDPTCPFCKKLEPMLESVSHNGYEVHIFPTPVHTQSFGLIASIACDKGNKAAAWRAAINNGQLAGATECAESVDVGRRAIDFFSQFGFNATPTLVNYAGATHVGSFANEAQLTDFANNTQAGSAAQAGSTPLTPPTARGHGGKPASDLPPPMPGR